MPMQSKQAVLYKMLVGVGMFVLWLLSGVVEVWLILNQWNKAPQPLLLELI